MIKVNKVNFTYEKSKKSALENVNFEIKKGEIFGFLGPSGAGKTTTQRLIIGLLRGYEGSIEVLGKERRDWGNDFYEKIGVAFDFPNLYIKLTAKENLKLIGSYYKNKLEDIDVLLDRVGLLPYANKRVESYSKGMKMRLNFIRSILHKPDLMFFDEPTSGLDPVNAKIIKDMITEQKNLGKTIFLTTHNMTVAEQLCDRVAFIVDGNISVIDSPKNLKLEHGKNSIKVEYINYGKLVEDTFNLETINTNEKYFDIMRNKKIKTIHSQEASLEDIFIKLTGRKLL
ncbi:ABC transporter ATP-binding protein [Oceanirhabdus sp. W0125-5]|uniref:ABC transporter ATP-binding protein n=1 Tax=Oceanirhabdus sp. W0125-5 TaxID=2999116 RepID=UPI0022F33BE2|nr:ABC transporter ATP-binding protein [Oceanirhabdus sp. W0125-5]WBW95660.1 ABC transporter ATP-binding protein [Oceanirhabdus sp. W0125-5]